MPTTGHIEDYINSLTEETTPDTAADMLLIRDATGGTMKKISPDTIAAGAASFPYSKFDVDAPPSSPGALDDEFSNSSLDGAWVELDTYNILTVTEDTAGLLLSAANRAGDNIWGIGRTIPNANWSITAKCHFVGTRGNYMDMGIAIYESIADATHKLIGFGMRRTASGPGDTGNWVNAWTDNTHYGSCPGNFTTSDEERGFYFRIRRNTTTYTFEFSKDGIAWIIVYSGAIAFVPTAAGVYVSNGGTGVTQAMRVDFFRYIASDIGATAYLTGRRL